jgi:copper transport protein
MVAMGALLRRPDEPTPVGRLAVAASVVGLVGVLGQIPIQAALATGQGLGSITQPGVFGLAVGDGIGWSTLVTGLGVLAILLTGNLPFAGAPARVAVGGAAIIPLGFAVTGHTRTMSPAVVGYTADLAHLVAGAAWFGGLLALAGLVRHRRAEGDDHGAVLAVAQFSGFAAASLAAVVVAGTAMGWIEVGSIHALTSTTYGKVLLVKVAAVALVVAMAAWNRYRLLPSARQEEGQHTPTWSALVNLVRAEAIGIVVVLGLTGALVNITPAKDAVRAGPITLEAPLGEGSVQVIVDPARVGRNDIHAYLLDKLGRPATQYETADFALSLPAQSLGPLHRTPVVGGPGHFQLIGTELTPGGTWKLVITVQPDRFTEQKATVTFRVR